MFQFHFGTIGSSNSSISFSYQISFNSTLVRLVALFFTGVKKCSNCFNSTLVRLVEIIYNQKFEGAGFNSTLVRLVEVGTAQVGTAQVFQFHFGTIGRGMKEVNCITVEGFQFHFGTIGSLKQLCLYSPCWYVSIPLWYDW